MPVARSSATPQSLGRWILGMTVLATLYHWSLWAHVHVTRNVSWTDLLQRWDAGWYSDIILQGYHGPNFAFYPVFPLTVDALSRLFPARLPPQIGGAVLSSLLFLAASLFPFWWLTRKGRGTPPWGLVPPSRLGWFFFVWSPASYIFQSHHTESTFLFLSMAAFAACQTQHFVAASILAGLCALTKNQGIFVAIAVGFGWALRDGNILAKIRHFTVSGLISGSLFALFPLYAYVKTQDFMAFYSAQDHWRPEMTRASYLRSLWFGNPWQNMNLGSLERYALFWLLVFSTRVIWKRHKPLGLYVALFIGVMPLSGEFVGTFRYASVLWPTWFVFAEWLESLSPRVRKALIPVSILAFLYLNHHMTRAYALGGWAY